MTSGINVCPKCGERPKLNYTKTVHGLSSGLEISHCGFRDYASIPADAISAWNRRPALMPVYGSRPADEE